MTREEKINVAKEEIAKLSFQAEQHLRSTYNENKLLGGSMAQYSTFEEYVAFELINFSDQDKL